MLNEFFSQFLGSILDLTDTGSTRVKEGRKLLRKKKFEKAIEIFYKGLESNPNDKEAYMGIGDAYIRENPVKNVKEAVACYHKAINIDPFFIPAYEKSVEAYIKADQRKKALEERKRLSVAKMLRDNPDNPTMNNNMGIYFLRGGRFQQSISFFQKCVILDPTFQMAYINLAVALFKYAVNETDKNRSQALFDKSVEAVTHSEKFGTQIQALLIKIRALMRLNRFDQAIKACNEAKRVDPSNKEIYTLEKIIYSNKSDQSNEKASFAAFEQKNSSGDEEPGKGGSVKIGADSES